ncbi:MAG: elongation factor P [Patescibacteria group bacterium]|nr:elongation factor P [Patescibacteria group bacterium]
MADTSVIKKGAFIMFKGAVHLVVEFQHVNPGKGSAFIRTGLRNIQTGKVIDNTFKAGESVEAVELDRANMQYLYSDDSGFHFMDNDSFEQMDISADLIGDNGQYLTEGQGVVVMMHDGQPLTVDLPKKLKLKVVEAMPAEKGDSAQGRVTKEVTLETGMKLQVPLFLKQDDVVVVNTETGDYVERA